VRADQLREKADVELRERLADYRQELFQGQFRGGQDEVEERGKFRKARREMARLLTILRERELGIRGSKPVTGSHREES
jgi:large subunit ribosomal protein L29